MDRTQLSGQILRPKLLSSRWNEADIVIFLDLLSASGGHKAMLRLKYSRPVKAENGSSVMSCEATVRVPSIALIMAFCTFECGWQWLATKQFASDWGDTQIACFLCKLIKDVWLWKPYCGCLVRWKTMYECTCVVHMWCIHADLTSKHEMTYAWHNNIKHSRICGVRLTSVLAIPSHRFFVKQPRSCHVFSKHEWKVL